MTLVIANGPSCGIFATYLCDTNLPKQCRSSADSRLFPIMCRPPFLFVFLLSSGIFAVAGIDVALAAERTENNTSSPSLLAQLADDVRDGQFQKSSLLEAVLIASGIERPDERAKISAQFTEHCRQLRESNHVQRITDAQRAAAILSYMHREILTAGYDVDCTEFDQSIRTGRYNCVSATVLFRCLADEFNLPVQVLESPRHMYVHVRSEHPEQGDLDIETTCPGWFSMSEELRHIPDPAAFHPINDTQLIAAILYNRGICSLRAEYFSESANLNEITLRLDPGHVGAKANLLATFNNWALSRAGKRDFSGALAILERGQKLEPDHEPFARNEVYIRGEWMRSNLSAGLHE